MECPIHRKPYILTEKGYWCTSCGNIVSKDIVRMYKGRSPLHKIAVVEAWKENPYLRNNYEEIRRAAEMKLEELKRSIDGEDIKILRGMIKRYAKKENVKLMKTE